MPWASANPRQGPGWPGQGAPARKDIMESIKIKVRFPVSAALKLGRAQAGDYVHELTDAQVAELSPAEREAIAVVQSKRRVVATPDWAGVKALLQEVAASATKRKDSNEEMDRLAAERKAEAQRWVDAWIAASDEETTDDSGGLRYCVPSGSGFPPASWATTGERHFDHGDVPPDVLGRRLDVARARAAAEKAKKEAEAEALRAKRRAWVLQHDEYLPGNIVRAAREGLVVCGALSEWLYQRVAETTGRIAGESGGHLTPRAYDPTPRTGVPTEKAYAILDAVEAAKESYAEATLGESVVRGARIVRVDVAETGKEYRTAIEIMIGSTLGWDDMCEYLLTEPPPDARVDFEDADD